MRGNDKSINCMAGCYPPYDKEKSDGDKCNEEGEEGSPDGCEMYVVRWRKRE